MGCVGRDGVLLLVSSPGARNASREALHQQRSWSSSGTCATPVWIPARRCAPSGMTTNEGADRDDVKKKGAPTGMMARARSAPSEMTSKEGWAGRDDVERKERGSERAFCFWCHPRAGATRAGKRFTNSEAGHPVALARRPSGSRLGASRRPG